MSPHGASWTRWLQRDDNEMTTSWWHCRWRQLKAMRKRRWYQNHDDDYKPCQACGCVEDGYHHHQGGLVVVLDMSLAVLSVVANLVVITSIRFNSIKAINVIRFKSIKILPSIRCNIKIITSIKYYIKVITSIRFNSIRIIPSISLNSLFVITLFS